MSKTRILRTVCVVFLVAAAWRCDAPEPNPKGDAVEVEVQVPPPEQPEEEASGKSIGGDAKTAERERLAAPSEEGDPDEGRTGQGEDSDTGASSETEKEWIPLFKGEDLTGWRNARDPEGENRWFVEKGTLTNAEHANDIATEGEWRDFELSLEYKIVEGGNSGVYLRGRVEVQVLDNFGKEEMEPSDSGGIYGQHAPLVNASRPAGKWNTLEARYVGSQLTVKLNGRVVLDRVEITEVTGGALPGDVNDAGPIMLQGDHGKIWFRDIKLKPLDPPAAEPPDTEQAEQSEGMPAAEESADAAQDT